MASTTIFVSGATGYIAQHIIVQLINNGYRVVGSVRSEEKGKLLRRNLNTDKFSYEVVEAIEEVGAFDEAIKKHPEVRAFIHTASPFHYNVQDVEKELLNPAINGTKNALMSLKEYAPQVNSVIVTSSYGAMSPLDDSNPSTTVTEDSWKPVTWKEALANPFIGYSASKVFAERAVWGFLKEEKPSFNISVINPVLVFGPQAFDTNAKGVLNTSAEFIRKILNCKTIEEIPTIRAGFIDVRDVAKAHIWALENKVSKSRRLLLFECRFTAYNILNIIHKNFKEYASQLPYDKSSYDMDAKFALIDNRKTRDLLGFKFIDLEKSVVDSVKQILSNQ